MTKVSASTLARRASKTKNPVLAKRLRAQAAKLRRDERANKELHEAMRGVMPAALKPGRNKIIKGLQQAVETVKGFSHQNGGWVPMPDEAANDSARAASVDSMPLTEQPGKGEVVGGYLAALAGQIAKLARKKGGIDEIQGRLMVLEAQTRHDAKVDANERVQKAAQQANEQWRENIVTGFLARCAALEQMHRGLPDTVVVDGMTLARVIDALHGAGYTARGKR